MSTTREKNRRRLTRNGITLKEDDDGTTHVVLRRHTGGAISMTVALSSDDAATVICDSLGSDGTRNERVLRVSEALAKYKA